MKTKWQWDDCVILSFFFFHFLEQIPSLQNPLKDVLWMSNYTWLQNLFVLNFFKVLVKFLKGNHDFPVRKSEIKLVVQSSNQLWKGFVLIFHKRRECLHQLWLWKSILLQMDTHLSCWKWTGLHAGLSLTKARGENFSLFQYIKYFYFPCQSQIASENITETITNHKCASLFAAWLNISVKTGGWGGSIVSPSVYLTHHTLSGHLTVELS